MKIKKRTAARVLIGLFVILTLFSGVESAFAGTVKYSPDDPVSALDGHPIAVQTAVLYEDMIRDRVPHSEFKYFTMPNDMILALKSDKVDAYLIEEVSFYVHLIHHPDLTPLKEPAGTAEYGIVIGNNDRQEKLLREINEFIAASKKSGMMKEMYDYWIIDYDPDNSKADITGFTGENGEVDIAVEGGYEPFSYISNGKICGYDVDFMARFCRAYGYTPVFHEVPFDSIAPGVEAGKYDFGMNIVLSDEREENVVLSDAYISCPILLIVQGDEASGMGFMGRVKNSFYITFIKENRWKMFVSGMGTTMLITLASIACGTVLGFAAYLLCRHGNKMANAVTGFFLWLLQGLPTVVLLLILYFIVFKSTPLGGTAVCIVGFSFIFACSMFDMLKVGCGAIGKGQLEASRALGYTDSEAFFRIILPQAARHFLPICEGEVVSLIKETAVVGYIMVLDLTRQSDLVRSRTLDAFFPLIATAAVYLVISWLLASAVRLIERRVDPKKRSEKSILKGIDTSQWR